MGAWRGVVLAVGGAGDHSLGSRLPTALHPLAGRPLAWHALHAVAALRPGSLQLVAGPELADGRLGDLPGDAVVVDAARPGAAAADDGAARVLLVDALAPTLAGGLEALVTSPDDALLVGTDGAVLAAWTSPERLRDLAPRWELGALRESLPGAARVASDGAFAVRSRADLARASAAIRDRTVRRLMADGVTFLLPETVLVDVGVEIGRDSVVYPGVVLEGETTIGAETVIGPCCRVIASRIGSGVELKGFNYVSHTTIRNRAILEAYVRRGYDG